MYLFVLFLGWATTISDWDTKSNFLTKLKKLGHVYVYQDLTHNIFHYELADKNRLNYHPDINFDMDYIDPVKHLRHLHIDICKTYKNIKKYKIIPVGWSIGGGMALLYSRLYPDLCYHVILLDSIYITQKNTLISNKQTNKYLNSIKTNKQLQNYLTILKKTCNVQILNKLDNFICEKKLYLLNKYLSHNLILSIPTTSFINIDNPAIHKWQVVNNKRRQKEANILYKHNPDTYKYITFVNASHYIFNKSLFCNKIIKYVSDNIIT